MLKKQILNTFMAIIFLCLCLFFYGCNFIDAPVDLSTDGFDDSSRYDLVVIGSDPEGIAAAVSGARNGLNTVLIDFDRDIVGGLYTLGWLNMIDLNYLGSGSSEIINTGIFTEIYEELGGKSAFDVDEMVKVLNRLLQDSGVKVVTDLEKDWTVNVTDDEITGLEVIQNGESVVLEADTFIDATQNADIAREAGVAFYDGQEEFGLKGLRGADTLVFKVDNVDWADIQEYMKNDGLTGSGSDEYSAWGYQDLKNCELSADDMQIRGPNLGLQDDGTILLNCLLIFNLDLDDKAAYEETKNRAIKIIEEEVLPYMAENFTGWEDAVLVDVAPEFYIRESYHMDAVKRLTAADVFESNVPEDTIAEGSYPIDLQARDKGLYGICLAGTEPYGIPFGTIVPKTVGNLLVVGKATGFDVIAFGSARTVPVGISVGEAAGVAAAIAKENDISSYQEMAADMTLIEKVQAQLVKQGVVFHTITKTESQLGFINYWSYSYISRLRDKGLIAIGYSNDYALDEDALRATINRIQYAIHSNSPYYTQWIPLEYISTEETLGHDDIETMIAYFLNEDGASIEEYYTRGVIDQTIYDHIKDKTVMSNGDVYAIACCVVDYMETQGEKYYRDEI